MTKWIALLWFLLLFLATVLPVEAAELCRNLNDRTVCMISIQRSAKNYWEYRAIVRVDGVERPIEVYNCRDRVRIQQDGTIVPFEPNDASKLVCRLFK